MVRTPLFAVLLFCAALPCAAASADAPGHDRAQALADSQAAIGRLVDAPMLRDTAGQPFDLAALRGRPVVVSLVYTACSHVCPMITRHVDRAVRVARDALGDDAFAVVTLGFDWANDTPERMRLYGREHGVGDEGWHLLSGDRHSVEAVTAALGFLYTPSAAGFDHLAQTTILDADGRVYRQVYGPDPGVQAIVEPLKQLVYRTPADGGLVDHWVDTLRLFCTVYDPNSGRYRFDYSIFMTIIVGTLCLGAIAAFIVTEWRRSR